MNNQNWKQLQRLISLQNYLLFIIRMFVPISRTEYHTLKWKEMYGKDDCPFCEHHISNNAVVWRGTYWYLLHNIASYSWDHRHIMAVPYEHICFTKDLWSQHLMELSQVHRAVEEFFWADQYFSFTRETMASRSVEHLHMHFLAWKLQWKFLRKMLELQGFPIKQELKID